MLRSEPVDTRYSFFTTDDLNARIDELSAKRARIWNELTWARDLGADPRDYDDIASLSRTYSQEISDLLEELINRDADVRRD